MQSSGTALALTSTLSCHCRAIASASRRTKLYCAIAKQHQALTGSYPSRKPHTAAYIYTLCNSLFPCSQISGAHVSVPFVSPAQVRRSCSGAGALTAEMSSFRPTRISCPAQSKKKKHLNDASCTIVKLFCIALRYAHCPLFASLDCLFYPVGVAGNECTPCAEAPQSAGVQPLAGEQACSLARPCSRFRGRERRRRRGQGHPRRPATIAGAEAQAFAAGAASKWGQQEEKQPAQ